MHRALQVQEILGLIFKSDLFERDLSRCALVCRLWAIWASDVLWTTRPVPLSSALKETGSAAKTYVKFRHEIVYCVLDVGAIEESGWCRFAALSNKVTHLKVDGLLREPSIQHINTAKETFHGSIFSQVQTLDMEIDEEGHETIKLIAGPSLLRAKILLRNYLKATSSAWISENLPSQAPNIRHLALSFGWNIKLESAPFSGLICLEVSSRCMSCTFWESLAHCPSLQAISLGGTTTVVEGAQSWRVQFVHFPALTTFKLLNGHPGVISRLMLRSTMPLLEHVELDARTGRLEDIWEDIVSAHFSHTQSKDRYKALEHYERTGKFNRRKGHVSG